RLGGHKILAVQLVVQLGTGKGVSDGNLNGFDIEFLGEINGTFYRLLGFPGQADDEISMDSDPDLFTVARELTCLLNRRAFFDVLQDLRIAGFVTNDEEPSPGIGHGLQRFIITVDSGRARPAK